MCIYYSNIRKCFFRRFVGTGKTATFSISILQSLDTTLRETQVLCLSPTRELAVQIQKVILALGDFMNVQCHAVRYSSNFSISISVQFFELIEFDRFSIFNCFSVSVVQIWVKIFANWIMVNTLLAEHRDVFSI